MARKAAPKARSKSAKSATKSPSKSSRSTRSGTYTIGIDLGGTKVAAALVDSEGRVLAESRLPTVPPEMAELDIRESDTPPTPAAVKRHVNYVADAMTEVAMELLATLDAKEIRNLKGIGLASAGPMDIEKGTLIDPANFKGWKTVPLVKLLSDRLVKRGVKAPVSFQNDAIAAALGEGWVGRTKGCSTYAMITVGTGIGSGVIFNGRPAQSRGMGSEWGHILVDVHGIDRDRDGEYLRSVEGLASGTGLILRAKARGFKGESAADLAVAARQGDKLALEMFDGAAEALAALLYNLSIGFHPEKFVVSGGMLGIKELFLPKTIELYSDLMKRMNAKFLAPVQVAQLGTQAGVIGAARLPYLD